MHIRPGWKNTSGRQAQKLAGEILWISGRTRPDVSFAGALVSSLATRAPKRSQELGVKVMSYLVRTKMLRLQIGADETGLSLYTDASFAPDRWVVMMAGSPLSWRSSRQTTVSISTAEAELGAVLEGGIALLGSAALLKDLEMDQMEKVIHVDSTSALAISEGSGSWRTRHLRVKAEWLSERLQTGEFSIQHCAGRVQLADLLTKVMTWARISELLLLWGFNVEDGVEMSGAHTSNHPQDNSSSSRQHHTFTQPPSQAARVLAVLLLLSTIPKSASTGLELWSEPQPLRLDSTLLSVAMVAGIVFLLILGWELLRWAGIQTYDRLGPGSTSRRLQRLQRLRDATARAIEDELRRRSDQQHSLQSQPSVRAGSRQRHLEGRATPSPSRSCTEGGSSSSAVVSIGTMTGGAGAGSGSRDVAVQAEMGFTYLAPPPVKEIRIEQVVHGGPYYVTDHGSHVHMYENCWGMRNARPKAMYLCKCCEQNEGRSLKDGSVAARG